MSYMIQPVQRVPRYVLLLKELKRNTTSADAEYHDINEAKRQMENMSKLLEGRMAYSFPLFLPFFLVSSSHDVIAVAIGW
jgi:hypothetical protein